MKEVSTAQASRNEIFKELELTAGLAMEDRASYYNILDEAGEVFLEHQLPTHRKP